MSDPNNVVDLDDLLTTSAGSGQLNPDLIAPIIANANAIKQRLAPPPAATRGRIKYVVVVVDNTVSMLQDVHGTQNETRATMALKGLNGVIDSLQKGKNASTTFLLVEWVYPNRQACQAFFGQDTPGFRPVMGYTAQSGTGDFIPVNPKNVNLVFNGNSTPLRKATWDGLTAAKTMLLQALQQGQPAEVYFYVMTDGEDNDSPAVNIQELRDLVEDFSGGGELRALCFRHVGDSRTGEAEGREMGFKDIRQLTDDPQALYADLHRFSMSVSASR